MWWYCTISVYKGSSLGREGTWSGSGVFTSYALNKSDDHPSISLNKCCEFPPFVQMSRNVARNLFFPDYFILIFDNLFGLNVIWWGLRYHKTYLLLHILRVWGNIWETGLRSGWWMITVWHLHGRVKFVLTQTISSFFFCFFFKFPTLTECFGCRTLTTL